MEIPLFLIISTLLQAPTPNPALYKQCCKPRAASHGPMDKFVQPFSRPFCRLRSASAPAIQETCSVQEDMDKSTQRLSQRSLFRRQGIGKLSRSCSAQVPRAGGMSSALDAAPLGVRTDGVCNLPQPAASQPKILSDQQHEAIVNAEDVSVPAAMGSQSPLMDASEAQPFHGPVTRSRAAQVLQPIATCSNAPALAQGASSGALPGQVSEDQPARSARWSKRRVMGTSLSADHMFANKSPRRHKSIQEGDPFATSNTRRRSDSPAPACRMDVDACSDAVAGLDDSSPGCCKQYRIPLRKQNTNVMKAVRSQRQPMSRTRSASHAYKLRSRSRPHS